MPSLYIYISNPDRLRSPRSGALPWKKGVDEFVYSP